MEITADPRDCRGLFWFALIWSALWGIGGIVALLNIGLDADPTTTDRRLIAVVVLVATPMFWVLWWREKQTYVAADHRGLTIRNAFLRWEVPWDEVAGLEIVRRQVGEGSTLYAAVRTTAGRTRRLQALHWGTHEEQFAELESCRPPDAGRPLT